MSHNEQIDPISRIQELLMGVQPGDATANSELETLLDQYPELWMQLGDVGEQAIQAWLTLVSGKIPVLAVAARKKLDALRAELLAGGSDVATRLYADRVTWLQVTYADSKYALADRSCLPVLEFLACRQKQAQHQHLSALNSWRIWSRARGTVSIPKQHADGNSEDDASTAPWILRIPSITPDESVQKHVAAKR